MAVDPALDKTFYCLADNYAGVPYVTTSITGHALSNTFVLGTNELAVTTSITGKFVRSGVVLDAGLTIVTGITGTAVINPARANWVAWSKIGQVSFAKDRTNDAGDQPMDWKGYVLAILKLDKNAVIYGTEGISIALPVSSPAPTYGFQNLRSSGIKSKASVAGNDKIHWFIDKSGELYELTTEGLKRLGYREFFASMTNPTLFYDEPNGRLLISDNSKGYIYQVDVGLGGGYAKLTGFQYVNGSIKVTVPEPGTTLRAAPMSICTDVFDFKHRGRKSIEQIQLGIDADCEVLVALDYRYDKGSNWRTTRWVRANREGVARLKISAVEFRLRIKMPRYVYWELDYANIQYKDEDKRFRRGLQNDR